MISISLPLRTLNPLNGAHGITRKASIIHGKQRKSIRNRAEIETKAAVQKAANIVDCAKVLPVRVEITRLSSGKLDAWDGLPASLKPVVDGIADAFGVRDDDDRIEWMKPQQRKVKRGVYGIEIRIWRVESLRLAASGEV